MANKVKILDGQGTQVFPITHVSAVLDDNGNSVGQSLGVLHDLYEALTQSNLVVVASEDWPLAELEERTIYRVSGTTSYTDYMYDGTEPIPMATYDNAIDDIPTAGSDNLVKSGGVASEIKNINDVLNGTDIDVTTSLIPLISSTSTPNSYGWTRTGYYIKTDGSTGTSSGGTNIYVVYNNGKPISAQKMSCLSGKLYAAYSEVNIRAAALVSEYSDSGSTRRSDVELEETVFPSTVKIIVFAHDTSEETPVVLEKSSSGHQNGLMEDVQELQSDVEEIRKEPSIIITDGSSSSFKVKVYSDAKKEYLTHTFSRMYDERDMTYGNNQTKHIVTCDCWYATDVLDKSNAKVIQGDLNFINAIKSNSSTFLGEGYYVGEGHGCAVAVFTKFFADGVEFDPTSLDSTELECDSFRIVEKVNYYADNSSLHADSRSYPKLDENGNMILANIHFANALYERNNRVIIWNRLTVKRDYTIFKELDAGMCRVYLPFFDNVALNDPDNTANAFSHDGTSWTFTDTGGSGILLNQINYLKGSNIVFWGDTYLVEQTIQQTSRPFEKLNYRIQVYNDTIKSFKIYQEPAIGNDAVSTLGESVEEFMNGDVIECKIVRRIDCKNS